MDNMEWSADGQLLAISTSKDESSDKSGLDNMDFLEDGLLLGVLTSKVRVT
jgi:hypothetical protein